MELKSKRVIVTGGVKGIGRKLVERLVDEEAYVGVLDIDAEGNKKLTEELSVLCLKCDISKYEEVRKSIDELFKNFGKIDVLVNNAGIIYNSPLISLTPEGLKKHDVSMWDKIIATNLSSVFYVTVNVAEKMIMTRTKGVIVNISSVCASGNPGQTAYSASKAGVDALTAVWAKELSPFGIRVVGIAPGYTDTESTRSSLSESMLKEITRKVPLRRLAKVDEIVEAIIFTIKNEFFNGKVLQIDGGLII